MLCRFSKNGRSGTDLDTGRNNSMREMNMERHILVTALAAIAALPIYAPAQSPNGTAKVTAKWDKVQIVSVTVPTTQILAHKYTLRDSPVHDQLFKALRDLETDYTRLQLWFSVANQAVPELKEPTATATFWDFKYVDPLVEDYYANTKGKHHLNMGTIPRWMFNVPPIDMPSDPGASIYRYTDDTRGDLLKDPTGKQFAEYQVRIYQWYTQGGFTDEIGTYHKSGHHYKVDFWDVLNEPDFENRISVEQYTKIYDAVTEALHKIDSNLQFFGPEVSGSEVPWARYFLDAKNHKPGLLPVAWFAFHNYAEAQDDPATWQAKYFTDPPKGPTDGVSAQGLAQRAQEVLRIRDELSPKTKVIMDEVGTFVNVKAGEEACRADEPYSAYRPLYWNANGANWAYSFVTAQRLGLPLISMSQMIGYPTQCPSISMFDKDTARPNAHYWVLHLISHNFGPGDKLVATQSTSPDVEAQASSTPSGRKLFLINTSNAQITVNLSQAFAGDNLWSQLVDEASGEQPPREERVTNSEVTLAPFAVGVISERTRKSGSDAGRTQRK